MGAFDDAVRAMTICAGCGHKLSRHTEYARRGKNRHGSRLVCTVDKCKNWDQCRVRHPQSKD